MSQLLLGCNGNNQAKLNVELLKGSIPGQVVGQFGKALQSQTQLKFTPVQNLQDLFRRLQTWQQKPLPSDKQKGWNWSIPFISPQVSTTADGVTLGDYFLKAAIEQKLIQPLEVGQMKWDALSQAWQELVTRNEQGQLDTKGKIWAAPYRWGSTVIVYRRDKFEEFGWKPPVDWADLWPDKSRDPKRDLRDRVSLLDQPREVIGLILKKLGKSYNTENLNIPELQRQIQTLKQQVKFFSSDKYLEPLLIGDTWVAMGWSHDVLPAITRYPQLAAIVPTSGTAVWADLWVRPVSNNQPDLLYKWINFCWQPEIAKQIALITKTNSPVSVAITPSEIQESLRNVLLINSETFANSEFLRPLTASVIQQYETLFAQLKS
jgi:putative spermidine/putrescine transport system substrate-binding protein